MWIGIDHGNRSLDDEKLAGAVHLAAEKMTLTVCPLSNLKLCVVKDLKDHPLRRMLERRPAGDGELRTIRPISAAM